MVPVVARLLANGAKRDCTTAGAADADSAGDDTWYDLRIDSRRDTWRRRNSPRVGRQVGVTIVRVMSWNSRQGRSVHVIQRGNDVAHRARVMNGCCAQGVAHAGGQRGNRLHIPGAAYRSGRHETLSRPQQADQATSGSQPDRGRQWSSCMSAYIRARINNPSGALAEGLPLSRHALQPRARSRVLKSR